MSNRSIKVSSWFPEKNAITSSSQRPVSREIRSSPLKNHLYHPGFHYASSRQFCSKFVYETYWAALGVEIGTLESFQTILNSLPDTPLLF